MTTDPDLTQAALYGGPQDGAPIHVDPDQMHVQVRGDTYRWDHTTTFTGTRRYRRVKP